MFAYLLADFFLSFSHLYSYVPSTVLSISKFLPCEGLILCSFACRSSSKSLISVHSSMYSDCDDMCRNAIIRILLALLLTKVALHV